MKNRSKLFIFALCAALTCAATSSLSRAAVISVSTSSVNATSFTVDDPDVGTYTVAISGFGSHAQSTSDNNWYFRNSSATGENDSTISFTVIGLDPTVGYISAFSLGTTKITPGVGSGSSWLYVTTLSATDQNTAATVQSSQTFNSVAGPFTLAIGDSTTNFGGDPTFSLFIDEQAPFSTRTIGTRDFTITAVPLAAVPEPASLSLLALLTPTLLRRKSRRD